MVPKRTGLVPDPNPFAIHYALHKKILTAILDTDHDVTYHPLTTTRVWSRNHSRRIQPMGNAGHRDEYLRPVGNENGFLWRIYTT
jgi:hypothetical protein